MEAIKIMERITLTKKLLLIPMLLLLAFYITACNSEAPVQRVPDKYLFEPGGSFTTNINHEDSRRVHRLTAALMFEVVDESAVEELENHTPAIRNAVLMVLGELTMEEVTTEKDLEDITQRIVERVNAAINSNVQLILRAYFTEFVLS